MLLFGRKAEKLSLLIVKQKKWCWDGIFSFYSENISACAQLQIWVAALSLSTNGACEHENRNEENNIFTFGESIELN